MKKILLLCLIPLLLFSACGKAEEEEPFSAAFTIRPPESLTEVYFDIPLPSEQTPVPGTTLPDADHTLRLEDLRKILSQSMFGDNPDAVVALWQNQIRYALDGSFTDEDRQALQALAQELMQIAPFPGMREADAKTANVMIRFADVSSPQVTCTKDAAGAITTGQITIPSSASASDRSAMAEEKMFRLFGFFYETDTPLESVLSDASSLTEADLILLEAAYRQLRPGMTKEDALKAFSDYFLAQ